MMVDKWLAKSEKWLSADGAKVLISVGLAGLLSFSPVLPTIAPFVLFGWPSAQASIVTWDGGGEDNRWSTPANWSDDKVPGRGQVATFDSTSIKDVVIDKSVTVEGIEIIEGYTGKLIQGPEVKMNIGESGWHQYAARFEGGADTIDVDGSLALVSGEFISSAGNLTVSGHFSVFNGKFEANEGSVVLDGLDQVVFGQITFNNLTKDTSVAQGLEFQAGEIVVVEGVLKLVGAPREPLALRSSEPGTAATLVARGGAQVADVTVLDIVAEGWELPAADTGDEATKLAEQATDLVQRSLESVALSQEKTSFAANEVPEFVLDLATSEAVALPEPTLTPSIVPSLEPSISPVLSPSPAPTPSISPSPEPSLSPAPSPGPLSRWLGWLWPRARAQTVAPEPELTFILRNPRRHKVEIDPVLEELGNGETKLQVPLAVLLEEGPGAYTLEVTAQLEDEELVASQDFTWGVLAMNLNQSTYQPGEDAKINIGVIDDFGHTICDANMLLQVEGPTGRVTTLSTEDGTIGRSNDCGTTMITDRPDYLASFKPQQLGEYRLILGADTKNGHREIEQTFEVTNNAQFVVGRSSATRIYHPTDYVMKIEVTGGENFRGEIVDTVPKGFEITEISAGGRLTITSEGGRITWNNISIQAGETVELDYTYDAPRLSPQFYLMGRLQVGEWEEPRAWQIASDATMDQPLLSGTSDDLSASATEYNQIVGSSGLAWAALTGREQGIPANVSGTLKTLKVHVTGAPGAGNDYAFTLMVDGSASALTCTISGGSATDCSDTSNEVSVTEKQRVSLRVVPTSTPTVVDATWSMMWQGTNAVILGGTNSSFSGSVVQYNSLMNGEGFKSDIKNRRVVNSTPGTLKNFFLDLNGQSPGSGKSYQMDIMVNGSTSGITCTISNAEESCEDATNTKALAAGDTLTLRVTPSGSPSATSNEYWGTELVQTTNGESPLWGGDDNDPDNGTNEFNFVAGGMTFSATEADFYVLNQVFTIQDLYVQVEDAPGAAASGKAMDLTLRTTDAAGDTALTCQVFEDATTCNDTSNTVSITDADNRLTVGFVPTSSPLTNDYYWSFTSFIAPATSRTRVLIFD